VNTKGATAQSQGDQDPLGPDAIGKSRREIALTTDDSATRSGHDTTT